MAAKRKGKMKSKKGRARKGRQPKYQPRPLESLLDAWALQAGFGDAFSESEEADTPLETAQQLMYDAFEAGDPQGALALAHQALEICPDCADAYVVMAEHATTLNQAIDLWQHGVAAGERALGEEAFRKYAGHFWGAWETRPYMRARLGLAGCLWAAGRKEEAVEHYQEMLRLNPNDNMGVRYLLAATLLQLERHEELEELLVRYEDDVIADWAYIRALLAFRFEGESERACRLLREAQEVNPHVPAYLTQGERLLRDMPDYITPGEEDEAMCVAERLLPAWKDTPGAVAWVRKTLKVPVRQLPAQLPWRRLKPKLAALEQVEGECWELDVRRMSSPLSVDSALAGGWLLLIINATEDEIIGSALFERRPETKESWQCLVDTMLAPHDDMPHRPEQVSIRLKTLHRAWQGKLKQIGIECVLQQELTHVNCVLEESSGGSEIARRIAGIMGHLSEEAQNSDLLELPRHAGEVWQIDARPMQTWLEAEGVPVRPWVVMVADASAQLILSAELCQQPPDGESMWRTLLKAMVQPAAGQPHRPEAVQVSGQYRQSVEPQLAAAGIECQVCDDLSLLDEIFDQMLGSIGYGYSENFLLGSPGVTPQMVGCFFEAAADFYRRAPWHKVRGDTPIKVECSKFHNGTWYAVVMGQSGVLQGLAMYEDPQLLEQLLLDEEEESEQLLRRTSSLGLTFGEAFEIAVQDLNAAEKYNWPVAGPEAYPCAVRINPGLAFRAPLSWELELLEGCLRSIPEFLGAAAPEWSGEVVTSSGALPLRLSWHETG